METFWEYRQQKELPLGATAVVLIEPILENFIKITCTSGVK